MALTEITSKEQFTELTTVKDKLIALYFHTPWATPCFQMNKVVEALSAAPQHQSTTFLPINADSFPEIADLFDITAVPYFVLIKNGTILKEFSGADPKEFANALESVSSFSNDASNSSSTATAAAAAAAAASQRPSTPTSASEESPEQLKERLKKLTTAANIMLFMKGTPSAPQCGFSRQMVAILREHQVRFGFFDILKDDSVRQGLKDFSDWPTFPQLYINGEFQGGLDIIKENLAEDPQFFEHAIEQGN